jgi:hypothetical protein
VCFQGGEQRFWVKDTRRDGKSAVAKWAAADRQGRGYCRNAHRNGSWAVCTGNFKPGTFIFFKAALFDMDAGGEGRHGHFDNRDEGRFVGGWSEIQVAAGTGNRTPGRGVSAFPAPEAAETLECVSDSLEVSPCPR